MTLNALERRAQDAGFFTSLHANALYIGRSEPDADGIRWEAARWFTTSGSGGSGRLGFIEADKVPADMLALLD